MGREPTISCQFATVLLAAGAGLFIFIFLFAFSDFAFIASVFVAGIAAAILWALVAWLFCTDLPALGDAKAPGSVNAGDAKGAESSDAAPTAAAAAAAPAASAPAAAPAAAAEPTAPAVKPSKSLPGEEELASKKGDWKYDADAKADAAHAQSPAESAPEEGRRPEGLTEARGGLADDLKKIKGIGPKLEKLCNTLGFYHFDQIAAWGSEEVAWVDQNLEGFKGRVTRDNWVEQAKLLASGGETAFSKKVDEGDVY
ncbi:MAG: endonuclease [Marinovum sp.]|nr:endonuclease [Marinovum sp.]